ncbi:hypothetical protein QQX13_03945 [Demequina sp. SYSU T00068]|uniref:hypothetical protein n=1 Tax=Demequina lignilytica TaxID=3051663 RepID=UPI002622D9F3|nr:hypothetical protein [Demequina sp. SYSU T00068]MDN4489973.1 hypothetical protein [Demequina sp. SYSU T00068]
MSEGQHLLLRIRPERIERDDRLEAYRFLHYCVSALVEVYVGAVGPERVGVLSAAGVEGDVDTLEEALRELHHRRTSIVTPAPLLVVVPTLLHLLHEEGDAIAAQRRRRVAVDLVSRGPQHRMHLVTGLTVEPPGLEQRARAAAPASILSAVETIDLEGGADLRPVFALLAAFTGLAPRPEEISRALALL